MAYRMVRLPMTLSEALQKTAEPIELPFGVMSRVGPRNGVLMGVHIGVTRQIRLNILL